MRNPFDTRSGHAGNASALDGFYQLLTSLMSRRLHDTLSHQHSKNQTTTNDLRGFAQMGQLLWTPASRRTLSWDYANALLAKNSPLHMRRWRLPTSYELTKFFRSGLAGGSNWPAQFYWSSSVAANGAHYVVHSDDAEVYVVESDSESYLVTLVCEICDASSIYAHEKHINDVLEGAFGKGRAS